MTKKTSQLKQNKLKGRNPANDLSVESLKTLAIRKTRQLSKTKRVESKISKRVFEDNSHIREQTQVEKELFSQILDESKFQCPVCLQLMIEPTLLQCGHAYCFKCLEELMIYKSCCGICRNVQTESEFQRSKFIEMMIESMIIKKSQNYLDYYCRVTDMENWKKVRNVTISELTKGLFVDFRDKELKWRKGEILKLTYNQNSPNNYDMTIRYKKDGQSMEQTIQSDSGRYTKFSYYTRMRYLQQKNNYSGMIEQFVDGQVMDIPFIFESDDDVEMDIMPYNMGFIYNQQNQQNNDFSSTFAQPSSINFNQFYNNNSSNLLLDQLFQNSDIPQPTDLIELLG